MLTEYSTSLVAGVVLMAAAATTSVTGGAKIGISGNGQGEFDFYVNFLLPAVCFAGSMIGGFLSIAISWRGIESHEDAQENYRIRRLATRFVVSAFSGIAFAPFVIENMGIFFPSLPLRPTYATIIAISCLISLFSILIIQEAPVLFRMYLTKK